jgi:putative ABC transport system ATP-binding protein
VSDTVSGLAVEDLVVEYSAGGYAHRPIDGLSFHADSGSLVLLLGPSGCGKTTLLSCIAGLLRPTSGSISVGPHEVTSLAGRSLDRYRQATVGIVFQAFNLVPSLTALENVELPMWTAGWSRRRARDRATELLASVGLSDRVKHRPKELSGGQQQRVAIARALALDPTVVLADEPTAHLDHIQVEGILRVLRDLAQPGRLVIVSTHDDRLLPLADVLVGLTPRRNSVERGGPRARTLRAGEVLFHQGERSDRVYVVERGAVALLRDRPGEAPEELSVILPGGHFGEMGPLFSLPRSASAVARMRTEVTGYTVAQFRTLVGVERLPELLGGGTNLDP